MRYLIGFLLCSILLFPVDLFGQSSGRPGRPAKESPGRVLISLVSRAELPATAQSPDTARATLEQLLDVAALADPPVRVAAVIYGGQTVNVVGGSQGRPTVSVDQLRKSLETLWLPARGANPVDEALQEVQRLVSSLPRETEVTILHLATGPAHSGRVREPDFEEIQNRADVERQRILEAPGPFTDQIRQAKLARFNQELTDSSSETAKDYLLVQTPLEKKKALEHCSVLKKARVHPVTVSLSDEPEIEELHAAAGGTDGTLLRATPGNLIQTINSIVRRHLPGLISLPPVEQPADPAAFESSLTVPVESLADRAAVVVEFSPQIADWDQHCELTAVVDGSSYAFDPDAKLDVEAVLLRDAASNVVAARLSLQVAPAGGQVQLRWSSPTATVAAPTFRVHTFYRLRSDIRPVLQPHLRAEKQGSAREQSVSPEAVLRWEFALRVGDEPEPWPVQSVAVLLKEVRTEAEISLDFSADPQRPGMFLTEAKAIPEGVWDAHIQMTLKSGLDITIILRMHVHSQRTVETISLEVPQATAEHTNNASYARGFCHFGTVGDDVFKKTLNVSLRSQTDYPLPVRLQVHLADPNGELPRKEWIRLSRGEDLLLMPGRPEAINLSLSVPDAAESALVDGLYEGQLTVLHAGTGLPIRIVSFEHVENTGDEPCETIRFTLERPIPDVALQWALRNWIRANRTGTAHALIRVSFHEPFTRTVLLDVTNTSRVDRKITVISNGAVFDEQSQRVPGVRLIPLCESLTEEFSAGETRGFLFGLEVDSNVIARRMQLDLAIDGPGLVRRHLPVRIEREDLLEPRFAWCLNAVKWCVLALGVFHLLKWWRSRLFRNGRSGSVCRLKKLFQIVVRGTGCHLESSRHRLLAALPGSTFSQPVQPGQKLPFLPDDVSYETPLRVKVEGTEFRIDEVDCDPDDGQVHARFQIDDGGPRDQLRRRSKRRFVLALVLTGVLTLLAGVLQYPSVVAAAQWLIDAITG